MVNHCSNPKCNKTLHYLREGRIYVFDIVDTKSPGCPDGSYPHHMEHYWLCGPCSETLLLEQSSEMGIRLLPKASQERRAAKVSLSAKDSSVVLAS
jgi:hypothetical protein